MFNLLINIKKYFKTHFDNYPAIRNDEFLRWHGAYSFGDLIEGTYKYGHFIITLGFVYFIGATGSFALFLLACCGFLWAEIIGGVAGLLLNSRRARLAARRAYGIFLFFLALDIVLFEMGAMDIAFAIVG